jgi:hypothetical protein
MARTGAKVGCAALTDAAKRQPQTMENGVTFLTEVPHIGAIGGPGKGFFPNEK